MRRLGEAERASGGFPGIHFMVAMIAAAALTFASGEAQAEAPPVAKVQPAKKTEPAKAKAASKKAAPAKAAVKKPLTAAARRKAAVAARKKEAARVARVIRSAGPPPPVRQHYDGVASFYGEGQRVASGGRFNPNAMTAAHRSLPFGTKVQVTDKHSGRKVVVTINDRGPFKKGRIIDLSRAAARALGMGHRGVSRVHVAVLPKHPVKKAAGKPPAKKVPGNLAKAKLRESADATPAK
jgi:rare lipoprotein A